MESIYDGIRAFQQRVHPEKAELFQQLAQGQKPRLLLITCSDSRIDPALITQTEPGEVFVIRNAGNIVPPWGEGTASGEAGTIEYAIEALGVRHIAVCGHSHCGAMAAVRDPESAAGLPAVSSWLRFGEPALHEDAELGEDHDELLQTVAANTRVQLEHLRSHPSVARAEAEGRVELHSWVYRFETGELLVGDADGRFRKLGDAAQREVA